MAMLSTKLGDRTRAGLVDRPGGMAAPYEHPRVAISAPPASTGRIGRRAARRFAGENVWFSIYVYVYGPEGPTS